MSSKQVPKDILAAIRKYTEDYWDDDADMVQHTVDEEIAAYIALQAVEFGAAASVRQKIIDGAAEATESWQERLAIVEGEVAAFRELQQDFDQVPPALIRKLKAETAREHPADYGSQRDAVVSGVNTYLHTEEVKAQIGPISELLVKMEQIIGNECYNSKIQNYGPGGVWQGEGRSFRYPVKFLDGDEVVKRWSVYDIPPEVLITGRYQFGSNELSIFRALAKVVEMIEREYGVRLADAKPKAKSKA